MRARLSAVPSGQSSGLVGSEHVQCVGKFGARTRQAVDCLWEITSRMISNTFPNSSDRHLRSTLGSGRSTAALLRELRELSSHARVGPTSEYNINVSEWMENSRPRGSRGSFEEGSRPRGIYSSALEVGLGNTNNVSNGRINRQLYHPS